MIRQEEIKLPRFREGFHLITDHLTGALGELPQQGLLHLFLRHTSAGLCLNENADPSVRADFDAFFRRLVPENLSYFTHVLEGPDDMPAHLKSALLGQSVTIPITDSELNLGTWQGIYLCEFRKQGQIRSVIATIYE